MAGTKTNTCPLEDDECIEFNRWCKNRPLLKIEHIPNESRSSKRDAAIRGRKLKAMGVSKGFWDYAVFIPVFDCDGRVGKYELVMIEMKRLKGSTTSTEQKGWGIVYAKAEIRHAICKGHLEAEKQIMKWAKEISDKTYEYLRDDVF